MPGQNILQFTPDQLVDEVLSHIYSAASVKLYTQHKEALFSYAVYLAEKYSVTEHMHDKLIALSLGDFPVSGMHFALRLAPRGSKEAKGKILEKLLDPSFPAHVFHVVEFVQKELKRELKRDEVERLKRKVAPPNKDENERVALLSYVKKVFPQEYKGISEHFRNEKRFWKQTGWVQQ